MPTFLIAYDLKSPGRDYASLTAAIKGLSGTWWHHLDSTWLLHSNLSVAQVRDRLKLELDSNDELLVIDVTRRPRAWSGFNERGSSWLRSSF